MQKDIYDLLSRSIETITKARYEVILLALCVRQQFSRRFRFHDHQEITNGRIDLGRLHCFTR